MCIRDRLLPDWFGIPESNQEYCDGVKDKPFYCVKRNNETIGFISLKHNNKYTLEIYVMGIKKEFHNNGCLLYTSDAADDLLCVDLGGRRIIKKKTKKKQTQKPVIFPCFITITLRREPHEHYLMFVFSE